MRKKTKIYRKCCVCGKQLRIVLENSRKYSGGNYFGRVKVPVGEGENKKVGVLKIGRKKYDVVKWTGKEKEFEYWECNKCFREAEFEVWLEEKIEK